MRTKSRIPLLPKSVTHIATPVHYPVQHTEACVQYIVTPLQYTVKPVQYTVTQYIVSAVQYIGTPSQYIFAHVAATPSPSEPNK